MNGKQEQLFAMYGDIAKVLDANGIPYCGCFGTAVGALRHGGFVPWDDDLDLLIREEDEARAVRALSEGLDPGRYYVHVPSADTHPHVILRTGDFGEDLRGKRAPFVDLFVLIPCPSTPGRRRVFDALMWWFGASIAGIDRVPAANPVMRWFPKACRRLAGLAVDGGSGMVTVRSTDYGRCVFPSGWFSDVVARPFESGTMPLPREADAILTRLYGDYMTPPPEGRRSGASGYPCCAYRDYLRDARKRERASRPHLAHRHPHQLYTLAR